MMRKNNHLSNRHITLVIFLFCSLFTFGQLTKLNEVNSFYMGKRNSVSLSVPLHITRHPNKSSEKSIYRTLLNVNAFPQINFTRALNNSKSLTILYSRDVTSRNTSNSLSLRTDNGDSWSGEIGTPSYTRNSIGFKINGHFKHRGNLAPIGNFLSFGARFHNVKPDYSTVFIERNANTENDLDITQYEANYRYITLDFGFTFRKMLTKKVFYDMSVLGAIPLHIELIPLPTSTPEERLIDGIKSATRNRFQPTDLAGVSLGIGIVY